MTLELRSPLYQVVKYLVHCCSSQFRVSLMRFINLLFTLAASDFVASIKAADSSSGAISVTLSPTEGSARSASAEPTAIDSNLTRGTCLPVLDLVKPFGDAALIKAKVLW